jgi:hypothetical protein
MSAAYSHAGTVAQMDGHNRLYGHITLRLAAARLRSYYVVCKLWYAPPPTRELIVSYLQVTTVPGTLRAYDPSRRGASRRGASSGAQKKLLRIRFRSAMAMPLVPLKYLPAHESRCLVHFWVASPGVRVMGPVGCRVEMSGPNDVRP